MDKGGEDTLLDTGVERDHFHTFISYQVFNKLLIKQFNFGCFAAKKKESPSVGFTVKW